MQNDRKKNSRILLLLTDHRLNNINLIFSGFILRLKLHEMVPKLSVCSLDEYELGAVMNILTVMSKIKLAKYQ